MERKSIIFGIQGTKLTRDEKSLFKKERPWGVILFSRNIKNIPQLTKLIKTIKSEFKDSRYPILIDQEGGNVSRLNNILNFSFFSQAYFGDLYNKDRKNFNLYYKTYVNKVSDILNKVGININTVPVLDVLRHNTHSIIGSRSFSKNANLVKKIGSQCIKFFTRNKIGTVIKHIPGHGLSKVDSHHKIPIVKASKSELIKNDFKPFRGKKSFFAMTAHVIYETYDPNFTATHSRIIIEDVIRKHIGFNGILISDDISMKALNYGLKKNATQALNAGCNLIMHCNGKIKEMAKLAKIVPKIDNSTLKKTSQFYSFLR